MDIRLPKPHSKQGAIKHHPAKRKTITAGRRVGKTTLAAMAASEKSLAGRRVLYAAPTQEQTDAFWDCCRRWFAAAIKAGYVYKNESRRLIEFPHGGRIRAKTAWDADTLRGDYADLLILDEFARMKANAWGEVGAPMLIDNDGEAWFISTPKRKNHFHTMHVRGLGDGERWASWHFTSFDNPHLSQVALDEITQDMSEEEYRQEILAEFLDNEGAVFRNIAACLGAQPTTPDQHKGHGIVIGVDWGKQQDYTVFSAVCRDCMCEVDLDRSNKIDYSWQRHRLATMVQRWDAYTVLPERNSMGEPIIEQLLLDGLPIASGPDGQPGFQTTTSTKPQLIESLALTLERTEVQWLDIPIATAELEAYERKVSLTTGRPTYSAPEGVHDDTVVARALARWAIGAMGIEYVRMIA
jgi:hypothetical protein